MSQFLHLFEVWTIKISLRVCSKALRWGDNLGFQFKFSFYVLYGVVIILHALFSFLSSFITFAVKLRVIRSSGVDRYVHFSGPIFVYEGSSLQIATRTCQFSRYLETKLDMLFPYQAFYSLKHYNLLKGGSFLIRKLNQPTSCLMLQFKGKIHLNHHLIAVSSKELCAWSINMSNVSNHLINLHCF